MGQIKDEKMAEFIKFIKKGKIEEHYQLIFKNMSALIYIHDTRGIITYVNDYVEKISHYKTNEIIGKHFKKFIAPEIIKTVMKQFFMHIKGIEIKPHELIVLDKDKRRVYLQTNESTIRRNGEIIGVMGIATDITEYKKTAEHLSKTVEELILLNYIGRELTFITDIDHLFLKILIHLRKTFGYERISILILDEKTNELVIRAAEKPFPKSARKIRLKLDKGITGYVAKTGKPYLSNDVSKDPHYFVFDKKTKSEVAVPLIVGQKIIGVINVEGYKQNVFDEDDIRLLTLIANQAAVAIENSRLYKSLEDSYFDTIKTLVLAMEAKDPYTRGHAERVRRYALMIAKKLKLSNIEIRELNYAGHLHDIGKIGISDFLLTKAEPLTISEYETIKQHPKIGHNMLRDVKVLYGASGIIKSEHERYNGTGYPNGLKYKEIPIGARVIAVADAFDAMTTDRPYRSALTKKDAINRLKENAGTQFDPKIVKAFLKIIKAK